MSKRSSKDNSKPGNSKPRNRRPVPLFDFEAVAGLAADTLKSVFDTTSREAVASTHSNADYYKERLKQATTPDERAAVDAQYEQSRREQATERTRRSQWNTSLGGLSVLCVCGTIICCTYMTKEALA